MVRGRLQIASSLVAFAELEFGPTLPRVLCASAPTTTTASCLRPPSPCTSSSQAVSKTRNRTRLSRRRSTFVNLNISVQQLRRVRESTARRIHGTLRPWRFLPAASQSLPLGYLRAPCSRWIYMCLWLISSWFYALFPLFAPFRRMVGIGLLIHRESCLLDS